MLLGFAQHVEEACGVVADFGTQFAQGDEFAGTGGHRRLLAVTVEHGELHQGHGESVGVEAGRGERALHAGDIAVVVRAPDIQHAREAALEFVDVVGDVGGEISVDAVLAAHHAILFVAEGRGAEPEGAVLLVEMAVFPHLFDGAVDQTGFVQGALGKPGVEEDAELGEVVAAIAQLFFQRVPVDIGVVGAQ